MQNTRCVPPQSKGIYAPRVFLCMLLLNQVSLRALIYPLFRFALGYVRAAALKPAWGFHPQTPSSLRGGFNRGSSVKAASIGDCFSFGQATDNPRLLLGHHSDGNMSNLSAFHHHIITIFIFFQRIGRNSQRVFHRLNDDITGHIHSAFHTFIRFVQRNRNVIGCHSAFRISQRSNLLNRSGQFGIGKRID